MSKVQQLIRPLGSPAQIDTDDYQHNLNGKVVLLGTPAEEGGGGKIVMLEAGAYDGMDICLMAHPTPASGFTPMFARAQATFKFIGHP